MMPRTSCERSRPICATAKQKRTEPTMHSRDPITEAGTVDTGTMSTVKLETKRIECPSRCRMYGKIGTQPKKGGFSLMRSSGIANLDTMKPLTLAIAGEGTLRTKMR